MEPEEVVANKPILSPFSKAVLVTLVLAFSILIENVIGVVPSSISASDSSSIRFTQAVFPKDMQQNKEAAKTPLARISFFIVLLLWGNGFSAFPIILNEPCLKNMDLAEL